MILDSLYLRHDLEWDFAGKWYVKISPKTVTLTRVGDTPAFLPGCLDRKTMRMPRPAWDSGERCLYPDRDGIPIMLIDPVAIRTLHSKRGEA